MIPALIILGCGLATAGLVLADRRGSIPGRWATKPFASAAFVTLALQQGALEHAYGRTVLIALLLCMAGDLLLIPDAVGPGFQAGLVSFLAGHVAFGFAFVVLGVSWPTTGIAALILVAPCLLVLRWLLPKLRGPMRFAVPAYILAIAIMVALSMGAGLSSGITLIPVGTTCFFLSDLSVAKDRFVQQHWHNRLWGLPLYYAATVMLALSVSATG